MSREILFKLSTALMGRLWDEALVMCNIAILLSIPRKLGHTVQYNIITVSFNIYRISKHYLLQYSFKLSNLWFTILKVLHRMFCAEGLLTFFLKFLVIV